VLICDRDRKLSLHVERFLATAGIRVIRTPFRAPNCNAHAERFVRAIKEECLNRVIPLGERHLRQTLADFVAHYHGERNHQDLIDNELIDLHDSRIPAGPFAVGSASVDFSVITTVPPHRTASSRGLSSRITGRDNANRRFSSESACFPRVNEFGLPRLCPFFTLRQYPCSGNKVEWRVRLQTTI
jgi:Integrase core domain